MSFNVNNGFCSPRMREREREREREILFRVVLVKTDWLD